MDYSFQESPSSSTLHRGAGHAHYRMNRRT